MAYVQLFQYDIPGRVNVFKNNVSINFLPIPSKISNVVIKILRQSSSGGQMIYHYYTR